MSALFPCSFCVVVIKKTVVYNQASPRLWMTHTKSSCVASGARSVSVHVCLCAALVWCILIDSELLPHVSATGSLWRSWFKWSRVLFTTQTCTYTLNCEWLTFLFHIDILSFARRQLTRWINGDGDICSASACSRCHCEHAEVQITTTPKGQPHRAASMARVSEACWLMIGKKYFEKHNFSYTNLLNVRLFIFFRICHISVSTHNWSANPRGEHEESRLFRLVSQSWFIFRPQEKSQRPGEHTTVSWNYSTI